ncbi:hypothetical protein F5144DRAFT_335017 [Chaetomium tenue]|uniref:Uncharacterized protein n=1 Tax=Chaetomium tenue TaxID=1854479 RepID=A0ACB7NWH1_9PEZI|nr:hypothetical protein F5144DRAFT_335017 [Chaetomium globosum]
MAIPIEMSEVTAPGSGQAENQASISIGRKRRREERPGSSSGATDATTTQATILQQCAVEPAHPCPVIVIPPPAQALEISVLSGPYSTQPIPHVNPSPNPPRAVWSSEISTNQPPTKLYVNAPKTRLVIYRLGNFLTFVEVFFPQEICFTPEPMAHGAPRFVSPRINGVLFQVTPEWLEIRGLPSSCSEPVSVLRRTLLGAILGHLQDTRPHGSDSRRAGELWDVEGLNVATLWWYGNRTGDGVVWPNGFGDLLVKWWAPGSLRDFLAWRKE